MTVSHNRPRIDKLWCLQIDRIMNDFPGIFLPIAGVSVPDEAETFREHGIETHIYKNNPVGEKHNHVLKKLKGRVTHVLHVGSDNVVCNNFIEEILRHLDKDIVWCLGVYFVLAGTWRARFWDLPYRDAPGPGKLMSAELIARCGWGVWDSTRDNRLDHTSYDIMKPHVKTLHTFKLMDAGALLIDFKSEVNINPYRSFSSVGIPVDVDSIYPRLSQAETDYLRDYNSLRDRGL